MNIALGIEYSGGAYNGWQIQPNAPTIQAALEKAIARFLCTPVSVICAGRTDTGVHATGQVVNFHTDIERSERSWVRALNTFLPDDIALRWAKEVPDDFHARYSAQSRRYQYWLYNDPLRSPIFEGKTGWVWRALDEVKMQQAATCLLGEHDFTSFRASECQANSPVRCIEHIKIKRFGALIGIEIQANAFLQHMVRNIVGSLVYVGTGRESVAWMSSLLAAKNRALGAPTFDASGLYMIGADYQGLVPQKGQSPFFSLDQPKP